MANEININNRRNNGEISMKASQLSVMVTERRKAANENNRRKYQPAKKWRGVAYRNGEKLKYDLAMDK
jgi:hypothetical protein